MKHLKKFNENYEQDLHKNMFRNEDSFKLNKNTKIEDFTNEFKELVRDDNDFEEGDELSMTDLLSETGELCNKYEMSSSDLQTVIDNGDDELKLIQSLYDETVENESGGDLETGCYWVKFLPDSRRIQDWTVGCYDGSSWTLVGSDEIYETDELVIGDYLGNKNEI